MAKSSFEKLQDEVSQQLELAAVAYLETGLSLFHVGRKSASTSYQPAVGNLCIAVELLLKTLIARKAFRFLYADLPVEAQVYLSYPETVPDAAAFRRYAIDLKGFKYKAPELDACISLFYTFFPTDKQEFRPNLSLLSQVRNRSVHAALPTFQAYDLHRVGYTALKLIQHFEKHAILSKRAYSLTQRDTEFLDEFDAGRVERVKKAVEAAKEQSKKLEHAAGFYLDDDSWEVFLTQCPVCNSDGFLYGSTELQVASADDLSLEFEADSFECEECGLRLDDIQELKLAGMDATYDRSDALDKWMADDYYEYD